MIHSSYSSNEGTICGALLFIPFDSDWQGSLTADSKFLGLRAEPWTIAQKRVHRGLYWFGPPESNTLHPVRVVVLFTLICSREYK
jgi:hypothetical protein